MIPLANTITNTPHHAMHIQKDIINAVETHHEPSYSRSIIGNHLARQECPDSSYRCQDGRRDEQEPIEDALTSRDCIPEDLQVEGEWEDDANGEAQE